VSYIKGEVRLEHFKWESVGNAGKCRVSRLRHRITKLIEPKSEENGK
jgi:hypothetical protein